LHVFRLRYGLNTPSASTFPLRRGTKTGLCSSCHLMLIFIRHNRYKCILLQRHAQPPIKSVLLLQIPLPFARLYVRRLFTSLRSSKRRTSVEHKRRVSTADSVQTEVAQGTRPAVPSNQLRMSNTSLLLTSKV